MRTTVEANPLIKQLVAGHEPPTSDIARKNRRTVWTVRMLPPLGRIIFLLVLSCCSVLPTLGACHVITPAGSGTRSGADWNNALAAPPSPNGYTWIRGDIYYLADGTYAPFGLNTADSGTTVTELRKAIASDHCTATGWNTATMGSSQAVITGFGVTADYYIVNGNGSQTAPGCGGAPGVTVAANPPTPSDCGIKIDHSGCSGGANACNGPIYLSNNNTNSAVTNLTFKYVELVGNGDNNSEQYEVFSPFGTENTVFTHVYMHNAGCVYFQDGLDNHTTSFSYFWGTEVNGATGGCHGQYMFDNGNDSNSVEHDNVYRDITGTAIWTFALTSTTHTNWQFYNNLIFYSSPAASWAPYLSDGIIACINAGTNCTNFTFMQNTVIGINVPGINNENSGSYTVENNLYYNSGSPSFNLGTGGSFTQDHNSCLNSGTCPAGTANVTDTSAPNPFVSWTTGNVKLVSENASWNNRVTLASPYTMDPTGVTRTTDRGAYQLGGTITSLNPPTGLGVVVR